MAYLWSRSRLQKEKEQSFSGQGIRNSKQTKGLSEMTRPFPTVRTSLQRTPPTDLTRLHPWDPHKGHEDLKRTGPRLRGPGVDGAARVSCSPAPPPPPADARRPRPDLRCDSNGQVGHQKVSEVRDQTLPP